MRELQETLSARDATPEQREAARRELARLLMRPGAASPSAPGKSRGEVRPPRAAIQPLPSIAAPVIPSPPPARVDPDDVARLEVTGPSRAIVNPRTGTVVAPIGSTVIDLRSGTVLVETPSGYMDPRTGQLIPK